MYVTVTVTRGSECLLSWKMHETQADWTFAKLLESILPSSLQAELLGVEAEVVCKLSKEMNSPDRVQVPLGFAVEPCCKENGNFIRYLYPTASMSPPSVRNVATVLMAASKQIRWPEKNFTSPESYEQGNGLKRLYDDIIDFLMSRQLGFAPGCESTSGKEFVRGLQTVLFTLQPHLKTLQDRKKTFVPTYFKPLIEKVYNDPGSHRHRCPPLSREVLNKLGSSLYTVLSAPWLQRPKWKECEESIKALAVNIDDYCTYLEHQGKQQLIRHRSPTPLRSVTDGKSTNIHVIKGASVRSAHLISRYDAIERILSSKPAYSELCLNDFAPINPRLRYQYIHELVLPFSIECYSYSYGNNLGTLWYVWRLEDSNPHDINKSKHLIEEIECGVGVYHTREMRRQFVARFGLVCHAKQSVFIDMYQFLTADKADTSISRDVLDRLHVMLDCQDPEVVFDLRDNNPGRPESYGDFWNAVKCLIHEHALQAVDDRRHGLVTHLAVAFSVPDLRNQILSKHPDISAPSVELIRCQFWPQNPFHKSSERYTGRFDIKFMVQSRQVNADHPDSHYCGALFRYLREFAILFRSYVTFVSQDDKHSIKVGEPGFPVAAIDRGKQVLVATDIPFFVGDHDFTKGKLIPTVNLLCKIPSSITETFYSGSVFITLKDAIFEPSSPLRHCCELLQALEASHLHLNPILCLYTDGGPDHRTNFLSVQVSLIALFKLLDLDMLVAARTAPHNSYRNPVERIMSLINIGLQSVGVMRQKMPQDMEDAIQNANTMDEVRKAADKVLELKKHFKSCLLPVKQLLGDILCRLSLKGENFQVLESVSSEDIDTLFSKVWEIEPSLQKSDSHQKDLKKFPHLNHFLEHCCVRRKYFFCIKKCGSVECQVCRPPRLPAEVFATLHQFPDPMKASNGDSFKEFQDVWGTPTTEQDRPSCKPPKSSGGKSGFRKSGETVRELVICGECLKPRCVYAAKSFTNKEGLEFRKCKEEFIYVCGSSVIPDDSELQCAFEVDINCESPISNHYYSARLKLPPVCYVCGVLSPLVPIPPEKKRTCQSIHPVCEECKASGKTERTRGEKLVGQKRKK